MTMTQVIGEVLRRRGAGEALSDEQVISEHPELMPQLGDELAALGGIHQAYLASRRAVKAQETMAILNTRELETPIELSREADADGGAGNRKTSKSTPKAAASPQRPAGIDGYQIGDEIASGGQAAAFKAIQENTGRLVAIKVMLGGAFFESRHRDRFEREVAILAKIDHPHVVGILDQGRTADGSFFLVMDYVDGRPIDQYVGESLPAAATLSDPSRLRPLLQLCIKVARAVQEAHRLGVVHRDLKPSNILVDRRGEPRLMDFGLARSLEEFFSAGEANGSGNGRIMARSVTGAYQVCSLPWASPEQVVRGVRAEFRSDVYSLGVTFYQLLTSTLPYPVDGPIDELTRHIRTTVPPPPSRLMTARQRHQDLTDLTETVAQLLEGIDAIVLKALAKAPADRYVSAAALADDLERCLAGMYKPAAPDALKPFEQSQHAGQGRRRRLLIVGGTAIIAALLVGVGTILVHSRASVGEPASPAIAYGLRRWRVPELKMDFVWLEPRTFTMGSFAGDTGRNPQEIEHEVRLTKGFWMDTTEVTQWQYKELMGTNPSPVQGDELPVERVSWNDANAFCKRAEQVLATKGHHWTVRLPTESEWEYACRAGTTSAYAATDLGNLGWFDGNSGGRAHAVGQKLPNPWGLYDMHGNVEEWCADGYDPYYPSSLYGPVIDPKGVERPVLRVVRGGSFILPDVQCRSAARGAANPETRSASLGFRVVVEESEPTTKTTGPATAATSRHAE
jgi:formylglycine-generating enzyme required for sulfatase activity